MYPTDIVTKSLKDYLKYLKLRISDIKTFKGFQKDPGVLFVFLSVKHVKVKRVTE